MRIASDRPIVPANVPSYAPAPAGDGRRLAGRGGAAAAAAAVAAAARPAGPAQESMPSCESGYTYPEPNNHRFVWGTCYAAHVATFDEISGLRRSVSPWMHTLDSDPVGLKYRCQWSPPLAIDWFDNSVYFGCQVIFRTRDRGQTLGGHQPRSLDRRSEPHPVLGRRRRRQPRPVLRRGDLGDRAIAHAAGRAVGRHQRRQGVDLARRRQEVGRPDEEREHAAVGHRPAHRRVALRSGHGLHGGGLSPRRQSRSVSSSRRPTSARPGRASTAACRRDIRSTTRCRSPRTRTAGG